MSALAILAVFLSTGLANSVVFVIALRALTRVPVHALLLATAALLMAYNLLLSATPMLVQGAGWAMVPAMPPLPDNMVAAVWLSSLALHIWLLLRPEDQTGLAGRARRAAAIAAAVQVLVAGIVLTIFVLWLSGVLVW